jgi:hypothetical protein
VSAYVVDEKTLGYVVHALAHWCDVLGSDDSCEAQDRLGQKLWALNVESVARRYPRHPREQVPEFRGGGIKAITKHRGYMAIGEWLYQSCEEGCDADPLYVQVREAHDRLAHELVRESYSKNKLVGWGG